MNYFLLILVTTFGFTPAAFSEPKFRYVDTEDKDKPKDENANKPPPKPAYYDNYKKNIQPQRGQNPSPAAQTQAPPPKMSDEDLQKISEALSKAPAGDYANPPKAKKPTETP